MCLQIRMWFAGVKRAADWEKRGNDATIFPLFSLGEAGFLGDSRVYITDRGDHPRSRHSIEQRRNALSINAN